MQSGKQSPGLWEDLQQTCVLGRGSCMCDASPSTSSIIVFLMNRPCRHSSNSRTQAIYLPSVSGLSSGCGNYTSVNTVRRRLLDGWMRSMWSVFLCVSGWVKKTQENSSGLRAFPPGSDHSFYRPGWRWCRPPTFNFSTWCVVWVVTSTIPRDLGHKRIRQ